VGFNAMQPGRVRRGDILLFAFGLAMIAALVLWAIYG
jgi:hypothetical protein